MSFVAAKIVSLPSGSPCRLGSRPQRSLLEPLLSRAAGFEPPLAHLRLRAAALRSVFHRFFGLALVALLATATASAESEAELAARASALHERIFTLDTHVDTLTASLWLTDWDFGSRHDPADGYSQCDLPRMREGGLDAAFFAVYLEQGPRTPEGLAAARDAALRGFVNLRETIARHSADCALALTADDGPRLAATGRRAIYLSIENGYAIGRDLSLLATYHHLGARLFGLVHNGHNDLADSAQSSVPPEWHGLSPLGRDAVRECNRLGLVVDASHASEEVLREVLALSATPILLSHSACRAIHAHPRNVSDDLLRELARRGGVIQLDTVSAFLVPAPINADYNRAKARLDARDAGHAFTDAEKALNRLERYRLYRQFFPVKAATLDDFLKHLFHAIDVAGVDHVGIGGDMDGGGGVVGLDDVTAYPKITAALLHNGLAEGDVAKIWGGNTLRVLRAVEDHARESAVTATVASTAPAAAR